MAFLNISTYKFVVLDQLVELRAQALDQALRRSLKGTVLVAPEGINIFLAGAAEAVRGWVTWLQNEAPQAEKFGDLPVKESWSETQPFNRMLVRLKKEIITMRQPQLKPDGGRAAHVSARTLKTWLDRGTDDAGRPVRLLDTRNDYEVRLGTFTQALAPPLKHFSHFTDVVESLDPAWKDETVVTFCTGGIRCEKAALYMRDKGFNNVMQLDGGILRYFEDVGSAHYSGDCFVFDRRVALTPELKASGTVECFACRGVVTVEEQQLPSYVKGNSCLHCVDRAAKGAVSLPALRAN
jgi:UPF0176 protein